MKTSFRNSGSSSTFRAIAESAAFRFSGGISALSFKYSLRSDFLSIEQSLLEESGSGGTGCGARRICPNALDSGTVNSASRRKVQHFHILLLRSRQRRSDARDSTFSGTGPRGDGSSLLNEYGTHGRFPLSAVKNSFIRQRIRVLGYDYINVRTSRTPYTPYNNLKIEK